MRFWWACGCLWLLTWPGGVAGQDRGQAPAGYDPVRPEGPRRWSLPPDAPSAPPRTSVRPPPEALPDYRPDPPEDEDGSTASSPKLVFHFCESLPGTGTSTLEGGLFDDEEEGDLAFGHGLSAELDIPIEPFSVAPLIGYQTWSFEGGSESSFLELGLVTRFRPLVADGGSSLYVALPVGLNYSWLTKAAATADETSTHIGVHSGLLLGTQLMFTGGFGLSVEAGWTWHSLNNGVEETTAYGGKETLSLHTHLSRPTIRLGLVFGL